MKTCALIPFIIIFFGLAWSLVGILTAFSEQIEAMFGKLSAKNVW